MNCARLFPTLISRFPIPRGSEQNGREYNFVPRAQFDGMVREDEFLEHAEVFGNCYGTAKKFLAEAQAANHDLVLDIDVQGAAQIKRKLPYAVTIFILPPDRKTLEWRLRNRGQDANPDIDRRLATAKREIENYDKYDYILVNDRLEKSVDALKAVVLAERSRRSGTTPSGEDSRNMGMAERSRLANMRDQIQRILDSFREGNSDSASGV
jgi:guanylate kinase